MLLPHRLERELHWLYRLDLDSLAILESIFERFVLRLLVDSIYEKLICRNTLL
jgi:hypothetical protein